MSERFGQAYLPICHDKPIVWCHAVSLGELNTAYPLLELLMDNGYHLWITSTTQTGFARAKTLFKDRLGKSVQHSFVPVDDVSTIERFLSHVKPCMAMFIETELWANTLSVLNDKNIPSVMANARLTQKSFQNYHKFAKLSTSMMTNLSLIIAQDTQSRDNFVVLGANADKVKLAYSLKWSSFVHRDFPVYELHINRPVWVMASTHEGEEELALNAHKALLNDVPNALLILVPRHPERFDDVAVLCQDFKYQRRSEQKTVNDVVIKDTTQVYLADSMGELMAWYVACDVAVVGGSFVDRGGHNPIEPASVAKPIIMGQYVKNCTEIVADLEGANALVQITDDEQLSGSVKHWLTNPYLAKCAGEQGQELVKERQGASMEQFMMIKELLK